MSKKSLGNMIADNDKELAIWVLALLKVLLSKEIIDNDEWEMYQNWARVRFTDEKW